ncbi:DUF2141 domain-containing protein [Candidatus Nitrospira salsa]
MDIHSIWLTRFRGQRQRTPACLQALALFACLGISTTLSAQPTSETIPAYCDQALHPVIITVLGVRNNQGSIKAKLYGDKPEDFLVSGKKLDSKRESAQVTSTLICLQAPHPGTYAIVVHHDENNNKKLDRNWIGLPIEGVGFSKNPELFFAPPAHNDVSFQVLDGVNRLDITLQY